MRTLMMLYALVRGKLTGFNRAEFGGIEYVIAPTIAGAQDPPEPDPADPKPDPEPNPDPDPAPEPEPDPKPDDLPEFEGEFDPERARRALAAERRKREQQVAAARKRTEDAERERDELKQAQETEQQRIERERDEARKDAEKATTRARGLLIEKAISDAALAAGVSPKRIPKLLQVVDTTDIEVDEAGEVTGATEAVEAELAEDDGYFIPKKVDDPEPTPDPEPSGGNPDRKRKPKPMTADEVAKLAKDDPEKFNQMFEEGLIPKSALGG